MYDTHLGYATSVIYSKGLPESLPTNRRLIDSHLFLHLLLTRTYRYA